MCHIMGVGIFWIYIDQTDLGCWWLIDLNSDQYYLHVQFAQNWNLSTAACR